MCSGKALTPPHFVGPLRWGARRCQPQVERRRPFAAVQKLASAFQQRLAMAPCGRTQPPSLYWVSLLHTCSRISSDTGSTHGAASLQPRSLNLTYPYTLGRQHAAPEQKKGLR